MTRAAIFSVGAIACSAAAVLLLWAAWRRRAGARLPLAAAIMMGAVAISLWTAALGAEIGIPLALESAALVAFAFILTRIELRPARPLRERLRPAPVRLPGRWPRGVVRAIGAGPISLAAALGIGVLFATEAPLADATRLILAGLLVPSLWAAAMIWTLSSRRPLAPAAGLLGIAVATIGASLAVPR